MAIQVRRGPFADLDKNKLLEGELAVPSDVDEIYVAKTPGNVKKYLSEAQVSNLLADRVIVTRTVNDKPLSSNITLTGADIVSADQGNYFNGTTTEGMLQEVGAILKHMPVNVKAFGAKGDGVTDDTVAIQACFDAIPDYGYILFPQGTYMVTGVLLNMKVGIHICGEGAVLKMIGGTNNPILTLHGSYLSHIRDMTFDGSIDSQTEVIAEANDKRDGIVLKWAFFFTFESCRIHRCKHDGLRVLAYYDENKVDFYNNDDSHIIDNFIMSCGHDGLYIDSVSGLLIQGNIIEANGRNGMWMGTTTGVGSGSNTVSGNTFLTNDAIGADIQTCSRITFSDNQVSYNGQRGMNFIGGREAIIKGNNFHINGRLATYSAGLVCAYNSDIVISGNMITCSDFTLTQGYGIEVYDVSHIRIKDNIIKDNLTSGVMITQNCADVIVRDNIGVADITIA